MHVENNSRSKTLAAVADACGVSLMTVSRALREGSPVKEETRTRIREAAERLGYFNNPKMGRPRSAASPKSTVDIVLGPAGRFQSLFYSTLLMTLERELLKRGCDCVVRSCGNDYSHFIGLADSLRQSGARATLLLGDFELEALKAILAIAPGALLLDNPGSPALGVPYGYVAFDNAEAARLAVRHLLENGRRRVALLKGPAAHYFSKEIESGYREALEFGGVAVDEALIWECDFSTDGARARVVQALEEKRAFDAIFSNDEMACGVLQALGAKDVRVPGRVAVVGCDGLPVGTQVFPRLTTVALDYEEMGRIAVERLLDGRGADRFARTRLLPVLTIRDSSVGTKDS